MNLDLKNFKYGWMLLSWAVKNGHEIVIKLLLKIKKIDLNL